MGRSAPATYFNSLPIAYIFRFYSKFKIYVIALTFVEIYILVRCKKVICYFSVL